MLANHLIHELSERRRELPGRLVPPLLREAGIATYVGKEKGPDRRLGRPGAGGSPGSSPATAARAAAANSPPLG